MSKGTASKQRDEARERLKALASAPTAPGQSQAARALEKPEAKAKPVPKPASSASTKKSTAAASAEVEATAAAVEKPKAKPTPKKPNTALHEKAEKISVSLHPQDQVRAERVEDALRKAGLIPRRAPTSFLLKVALAAFDEKNVEGLPEIVEKVRAQDGRGKWMHALKG